MNVNAPEKVYVLNALLLYFVDACNEEEMMREQRVSTHVVADIEKQTHTRRKSQQKTQHHSTITQVQLHGCAEGERLHAATGKNNRSGEKRRGKMANEDRTATMKHNNGSTQHASMHVLCTAFFVYTHLRYVCGVMDEDMVYV